MNEQVLNINGYNYHIFCHVNSQASEHWVLLHGFMGSHHDFDAIVEHLSGTVLTLDLLGFGSRSPYVEEPKRFDMFAQITDLQLILKKINWTHINLLGYSMGGRLALGFAVKYPKLVKNLYLESSTAGLQYAVERQQRILNDEKKAQQIECDFPAFVKQWEQMPLFNTQKHLPVTQQVAIRQQRLSQHPKNVANSLRYMGTGSQPNFWPNLVMLQCPTLLLVGSLDTKFRRIASDMNQLLPHAKVVTVAQAGHNVHFEAPKQVIEVLNHVSC